MKIQPIYTSKENSIRLKEIGFDVECNRVYDYFGNVVEPYHTEVAKNYDEEYPDTVTAPEHWVVIEWLKQVHGIWISVEPMTNDKWYYTIKKFSNIESKLLKESFIYSPSDYEATEAAIECVCTNLIKKQ